MNSGDGAEVAAWAAERGWTVVPGKPGTKYPFGKWGHVRYRDPETVRREWPKGQWTVCVATEPSGLVCDDLDVDKKTGDPIGVWSLEEIVNGDWGKIPPTFTLATPSGGTHLVWQSSNGREFKTCANQIAPGFDVRGRGGQFVLWDPTQPSRVVTDDREPAVMPGWLAELHPEPGSAVHAAADIPNVKAWLDEYGQDEELCEIMIATRDKWLAEFGEGLPHEVMKQAQMALVGDRVGGHTGLNIALNSVKSVFEQETHGRKRGREWLTDWRRSLAGAIRNKVGAARGRIVDEDPCRELDDVGSSVRKQRNSVLLVGMRDGSWLDSQSFPALQYAVPEMVPEGCVLLVGASKIGKSTLVRRIGLECARGGKVFGLGCDKRDVFYMALEDDEASMQLDCRSMLEGDPIPGMFRFMFEIKPGKLIQTVSAYLDTYPRGLVIVDVLGRAMEPAKRGETTYERDYRIMTMLKSVAKEHPGSTTIVSHHSRKGKSEDWLDSVSGTNAIAGAADTIIKLSRKRGEKNGLWQVTSRKPMDDAEYALVLERPAGWRLDGDDLLESSSNADLSQRSNRLGDRSIELIDFVNGKPNGVRAADVAKELGISPKDAGTYLLNSHRRGDIAKIRYGVYGPVRKQKASKDKNDDLRLAR